MEAIILNPNCPLYQLAMAGNPEPLALALDWKGPRTDLMMCLLDGEVAQAA